MNAQAIEAMPALGGSSGTIGGSIISAILGVNPWSSPHDAWSRIVWGKQAITNAAMERGTRLEPHIIAAVDTHHLSIVPPARRTILHTDERFTASVDGEVYGADGALLGLAEIKTSSPRADWRTVPEHYQLQGQHYLWIRNLEAIWFVCLQAADDVFRLIDSPEEIHRAVSVGSAKMHVHRIERDPDYAAVTVPRLIDWWEKYIDTKTPPPADDSTGSTAVLRRIHSKREGLIELTDEIESAARDRVRWKEVENDAKKQRLAAENRLRELLGSGLAAEDRDRGIRVEIATRQGRQSFNQTEFKLEHPKLFEEFTRTGADYDAIKIKGLS